VKVLSGRRLDARTRTRFLREARVTAGLNHPGIVKVHAAGEAGDWIAYELIEGCSLADALAAADLPKQVALVRGVAEALGAAHAAGILHRDVKAENVLVDPSGHIHVVDFGLASALELERLTRTGELVGTPAAMAPEQFEGEHDLGPETDVWAVGVLLYEALTGEHPFPALSLLDLISLVTGAEPVAPRVHDPSLPAPLEAICLCALAKAREDRYPDGAALAEDLRRYERGEPVAAADYVARALRRRWARLGLSAAALLSALAGASAALAWAGSPPPPPHEPAIAHVASEAVTEARAPDPAPVQTLSLPKPSLNALVPGGAAGEALALRELRELARTGDPQALYSLGCAYLWGRNGLERDWPVGVALLTEASARGEIRGEAALGNLRWVEERYDEAVVHLRRAAKVNDGLALLLLARAHRDGLGGLEADREQALALFARATSREANRERAALLLERGHPEDENLAFDLLSRAHDHGDRWAALASARWVLPLGAEAPAHPARLSLALEQLQANLDVADLDPQILAETRVEVGRLLLRTPGQEEDGAALLRAAAEGGENADAHLAWGLALARGLGVRRQPRRATQYLRPAARRGVRLAKLELARLSELRWITLWSKHEDVGPELPPRLGLRNPTGKAPGLLPWFEELAAAGDPDGQVALANALRRGWGTERDPSRAYALYEAAASAGHPRGLFWTSMCLEGGIGCEADEEAALATLRRAAAAGDAPAEFRLAEALRLGRRGLEEDRPRALTLHLAAAARGHPTAAWVAGYMHREDGDLAAALPYLRQAAEGGIAHAMVALWEVLEAGEGGVPQDLPEARRWLEKAADAGNRRARKTLRTRQRAEAARKQAAGTGE
jgi:TPR repeat protein